jgi:tetratricopeptide (TPR) repeat protein
MNDDEEEDLEFDSESIQKLISRFESALSLGTSKFFDVEEFIDIQEHYLMFEEYDKALAAIKMGQSQHPNAFPLNFAKAKILQRMGKPFEALNAIESIEKSGNRNVEILLFKAEIFSEIGNHDKSIHHLLKALDGVNPDEKTYLYLDIASEYHNKGDTDRAKFYYQKAITGAPNNDLGYLEYFFLLQMEDNLAEGALFFEKLTDKIPYNALTWYYLGLCYQEDELPEKAIQAFDFATIIREDYGDALVQKAECYMDMQLYNNALEALHAAEGCYNNIARVYYLQGECYEQLEKWEEGFTAHQLAARTYPDMAEAWIGMAICLDAMGNIREAISYAKHAIKIDPDNMHFYLVKASLFQKTGKLGEAETLYQELFSGTMEKIPELYTESAAFYITLDDYLQAKKILEKGLTLFPSEPDIHYRLGAVLLRSGKRNEGLAIIANALNLDFQAHKELFTFIPELADDYGLQNIIENHPEYGNQS